MNPLVGGLEAPSSAPSYFASASSTAGMAAILLVALAVLYGLIAGFLYSSSLPRFRQQMEVLRDYLAAPLAALGLGFALVLVRFAIRVWN